MELSTFDHKYIKLTIQIDRHIEGYIDAYNGPEALRTAAQATERPEAIQLLSELTWLQEHIPDGDAQRQAYLRGVLRAIECTLHMLRGDEIPYLEEVNRIYDIEPVKVEESEFNAAHAELDTLLAGTGSIVNRIQARRDHYTLPQAKVLPLLELARDEARRRTLALIELPPDESVTVTLTSDQPWGAYNWYKGNGRSHIEFNTDMPLSALGLIGTFAHEGYPGHHTEGVLKEQKLWREKGFGEVAVFLLHSPAAVIAEGIASAAVEMIFDAGSHHDWTEAVLLPAAGITPLETAAEMRRLTAASDMLRYVSGNAAILYHTGQLNQEQTIDYICTYSLRNPARAQKSFSFISHPLFRSYIFTYTQGYALLARAASGEQRKRLFRRLLTEQLLPSDITATQI